MEALVLTAPHEFEIREVPRPEPAANEVLCRVRAIAICGTDAEIIEGSFAGRWPRAYPYIPGHEWSGEVVAAGPIAEQNGFTVGTRVAGTSHSGCGLCRMCRIGRYNLCFNYGREDLGHRQYGHYSQGAYAEYVVHTIKAVFPIPDGMPFDTAALCDTASIALHSVRRPGIEPGDLVASVGSGGMGLLSGCARGPRGGPGDRYRGRERLERARELGFETVDYHDGDPVAQVRDWSGGIGVDVAVDSAGSRIRSARRSGWSVRAAGSPSPGSRRSRRRYFQKVVLEELDLYGVRANRNTMELVIPLIADGRISADRLITHHFPLREFARRSGSSTSGSTARSR